MRRLSKTRSIFLLLLALFVAGCQEKEDTPVKGSLKCYVDESLYNVVKAERDTFMVLYPQTKIEIVSVKAREGIAAVLNGETRLFISSRNLNEEEQKYFKQMKPDVRGFKFCYDAVVPIVKERSSTDEITLEGIQALFSEPTPKFKLFVPENNSGVYEYLKDRFGDKKDLKNVTLVKSEAEVIERVKSTNKGLGFVGLNSVEGVKGIKILEVGKTRSDGEALYFKPYVAYLVSETYPLIRTTTILINDPGVGIASGFATFLTSYEGQKIVSKNNLGPATVPVKMVELNRR